MLRAAGAVVPVLLLGTAMPVNGFEYRWTAGLDIHTERLTGKTGVNGVLFRMERATGRDVSVLAQRMFVEWRRDLGAGAVLSANEAGWRLFSRIYRGESEVVQWRGVGSEAELIWSITDLAASGSAPLGNVPRPRDCSWMPPVHGDVQGRLFLQTSGRCPRSSTTVASELRQLLLSAKWVVHRAGAGLLQIEHDNQRAHIAVMPSGATAQAPMTNVVIVEFEANPAWSP